MSGDKRLLAIAIIIGIVDAVALLTIAFGSALLKSAVILLAAGLFTLYVLTFAKSEDG